MQNNQKLIPSKKIHITADELRSMFDYQDGNLYAKKPRRGVKQGAPVGYKRKDGYTRVKINQQGYMLHRLIWFWHYSEWPDEEIDHEDTDCTNNRIGNLRLAEHSGNITNRGIQSNNTSGIKGVVYEKNSKKWKAYVSINKKLKHLGTFATKELAAEFRQLAAEMVYGNFARHA
jgi:hypothetical protein